MNNETVYIPPLVVNTPTQDGTYWFRGTIKEVQVGMVHKNIDYPHGFIVYVSIDGDDWWMSDDEDMYCSSQVEGQFELILPPSWRVKQSIDF